MAVVNAPSQFWDNIAEQYAQKPVPNPAAYQQKLLITKEQLRPDAVILDVGCGTGSLALELAPHARHVHGVDFSSEMIRIARKKAADRAVVNVTFHQAGVDQPLSFEPERFDGICAYNLLHLVRDRPTALAQLFRLLRPGGFFISSTECLGESYVPFGLILPIMRWLKKAPPVYVFRRATLNRELRTAGFVDLGAPDVGAQKTTAFIVAKRPAADGPIQSESAR